MSVRAMPSMTARWLCETISPILCCQSPHVDVKGRRDVQRAPQRLRRSSANRGPVCNGLYTEMEIVEWLGSRNIQNGQDDSNRMPKPSSENLPRRFIVPSKAKSGTKTRCGELFSDWSVQYRTGSTLPTPKPRWRQPRIYWTGFTFVIRHTYNY